MGVLFKLFIMFVKLCAFAFGGGYVMIPSMVKVSEANHWASAAELTDVIAIAGMAPGPVAVNAAVGFGYKVAGFSGAVVSFLGIAIPCAVIVIVVATFFFKAYNHPLVQAALNGLRPVITGIILYAAVSLAIKNGMILAAGNTLIPGGWNITAAGVNLLEVKSLILIAATFLILIKTKIQPIFLILAAGVLGVFLY